MAFPVDKRGGRARTNAQLSKLGDVLETYNLAKLPTTGADYTWNNKQEGEANIYEKLDQYLANEKWNEIFLNAQIRCLPYLSSYHRPLLLIFDSPSH